MFKQCLKFEIKIRKLEICERILTHSISRKKDATFIFVSV